MDHDRLFKDLLTAFLAEFLELFFPAIAEELDRENIQFLDKEIFTDVSSGERHEVDLLAKVKLRGREAFILIHVENQSSANSGFPRRMFQYFSLLDSKFGLPIYPIAVFSYDRPRTPAPDRYEVELFDLPILKFQFASIQLNRLNWRDFLNKPNPIASALMTKMNFAVEDRPYVKLECLRMLVTLKLNRAKMSLIGGFMNSYLELTASELNVYNEEVQSFDVQEKVVVMQIVNEWTKLGSIEGRAIMVKRLLRRRFGELPTDLVDRIQQLDSDHLDALGDELLDFKTLSDAQVWLDRA